MDISANGNIPVLAGHVSEIRRDYRIIDQDRFNLSDGNAMFLAFLPISLIPIKAGNYLFHGTILYIRIYIVKAADHL
ncbi:MAG: hypothetical protein Dbin4_00402 [Alphaproteobacteria bacterium]|nr:hypothetical protein [Alphaproteobacteria bacterium]